jgi:hypothetical protein
MVAWEPPDFLLIAFSGHGFDDDEGRSYINLRDGHEFAVEELRLGVARQITIIDACRVVVPGYLPEATIRVAGVGDVSGLEDNRYRVSCRAKLDAQIGAVAFGEALLKSCSTNQTSNDYPTGGLFTHALVEPVRTLAAKVSNGQHCSQWHSVRKSFDAAHVVTQHVNSAQWPVCHTWDQGNLLPFAVA